jgi:hypothetical protein
MFLSYLHCVTTCESLSRHILPAIFSKQNRKMFETRYINLQIILVVLKIFFCVKRCSRNISSVFCFVRPFRETEKYEDDLGRLSNATPCTTPLCPNIFYEALSVGIAQCPDRRKHINIQFTVCGYVSEFVFLSFSENRWILKRFNTFNATSMVDLPI